MSNEKIIRQEPYISYYFRLFGEKECENVVRDCGEFKQSYNYSFEQKQSTISDYRTSESFYDTENKFDEIKRKVYYTLKSKFWYIENFNINHIEPVQVQKYDVGCQYKQHKDYFNFPDKPKVTENERIATAILYLNDGFEGGETYFNRLGLKVTPERGSLLFFDYKYIHDLNMYTLHEGLPVTQGTKYIMTFWIRHKPFDSKRDNLLTVS